MAQDARQIRYLTVKDLIDRLRLSDRTIYTLLENGILPGVKIGGVWRTDPDELEKTLRSQK